MKNYSRLLFAETSWMRIKVVSALWKSSNLTKTLRSSKKTKYDLQKTEYRGFWPKMDVLHRNCAAPQKLPTYVFEAVRNRSGSPYRKIWESHMFVAKPSQNQYFLRSNSYIAHKISQKRPKSTKINENWTNSNKTTSKFVWRRLKLINKFLKINQTWRFW